MIVTVKGKVFTGLSEGKRFIELPWVNEQIKVKLGFEPFPGTLNLSLSPDVQVGKLLSAFEGWKVLPKEGYSSGRFYRALINGRVACGVVRPEVPDYPEDVIEVVASVCLREEFGLEDGDEVEVEIWLE
ncbi:MAG: CTP-dependent riboflavin kinase [Candidatus Bathyarchaeota archaeon]|nr:CTP-dependent riboflavin kinase [Candidatus Bathyarchaeota archaeon]